MCCDCFSFARAKIVIFPRKIDVISAEAPRSIQHPAMPSYLHILIILRSMGL